MREADLSSSVADLDGLWSRVDKVRSTSKSVTVDKSQLAAVLVDHARMASALFGTKFKQRHAR